MPETYTGTEGTSALAAGMTIMDGTEPANKLHLAVNKARDYIASFYQAAKNYTDAAVGGISLDWASITGKPSTFPPSAHTHSVFNNALTVDALTASAGAVAASGNVTAGGNVRAVGAWSNDITSTRRAVWMDSSGWLGWASSSRKKKQNIRPAELTVEQLRGIPVVLYRYRAAVRRAGDAAPVEIGTIAEDLHKLDLWQFVIYEDGVPVGVHYDLLALAALSLAQQLADRMDDFDERLRRLEP